MDRSFLLIPGPWMGAWVWEMVVRSLRTRGHRVRALTLSGLADPDADVSAIGLATHVDDVLSALKTEEPDEVILVSHSYSGLVAGQVADRAPDRVAHTVFVEAFLPHDGRSMLHAFPEGQRAAELRLIADNHGRWPAPDAMVVADGQDLTPQQAEWLASRFVGHPGRTVTEPAVLTRSLATIPATYVVCAMEHFGGSVADDVSAMRASARWSFRTLDTGHWPMLSAPGELAGILDEVAAHV